MSERLRIQTALKLDAMYCDEWDTWRLIMYLMRVMRREL